MNRELPDVQAGFRKGRGTRDQIANIHWIIEKAREFQKNIHFCFIDYAKAFVWITTNCGNSSRDGNTRPPDLPLDLMNATSCVIVIFMNNQFVHYGGDMAVGAYSIANSVVMMFFMFVMGVCQGMQPIVGYNYGAEKYDRMLRCLFLAIGCATAILLVGWTLSMLFPRQIARIFTTDETLINLSARGIKLDMLVFFVVGSQAVITHFFQSIGKVKVSIFLSLSRQLFLLLPMAFVFPLFWDLDGVWYSMPASDFGSFAMTIPMLMWYMKKFKVQGEKEAQL